MTLMEETAQASAPAPETAQASETAPQTRSSRYVRAGSLRDREDERARCFPNMEMAHEVATAQHLASHVVRRLEGPDWWATGEHEDLPELLTAVERLARTVAAAQSALAGHVAQAYDSESDRDELLGVPRGKSPHRDAADYLRSHLRVDRREARRRIARAEATRQRQAFVTAPVTPPALPRVSLALTGAAVDPAAVDVVVQTLTAARTDTRLAGVPDEEVEAIVSSADRLLSDQLTRLDTDSIRRLCHRWRQNVDAVLMPDHAAPTGTELAAAQGMFYRGRRRGLHRWDLLVTDAQHEVLQTVASAATNPRATGPKGADLSATGPEDVARQAGAEPDQRTRGQQQADTLISALGHALAHAEPDVLPASGGYRPQVLVTIDHQTLLRQVREAATSSGAEALSSMDFTGPVDPREIRRIACDADLVPVVLGGEGEILDLGRARRLFTRAQRKAIAARDGGCAAPGCTVPVGWCEVHHIDHWEHGGPTDVDNGVLLCSHHHHAVHAGWWGIDVDDGIPWFTPSRHLDPDRTPRRNQFHRTRGHPRRE
ncbi:HNH endonuclease [Micrococcus luteus]